MNTAVENINACFDVIETRLARLEEVHLEWLKAFMAFEPKAITADDDHFHGYGFGEDE